MAGCYIKRGLLTGSYGRQLFNPDSVYYCHCHVLRIFNNDPVKKTKTYDIMKSGKEYEQIVQATDGVDV